MGGRDMLQIGEVAEAVGLSLRTIRYYDEQGIVEPSGRSPGGFRLYTDADVARLRLVKDMKPLDFTLDEIREVLRLHDGIDASAGDGRPDPHLVDRLTTFVTLGEQRVDRLRDQLRSAERVVATMRARAGATNRSPGRG